MDKLSEMSHVERVAYLASKVALAKSYDSPVLTVPIPDLEILLAELEATEIKPEGMKLMSEAIGAHGYIVGCLVQGRPDLALEESRKWVDAFSQAAELINNG